MAEEQYHNKGSHEYESAVVDHDRKEDAVESTDRGLFADLLGKKEEKKPQEEVIVSTDQFEEKVAVSEVPEPKVEKKEYKLEEEKKHDLLDQKLPRSKSSSSSSSDEEEGEGEEKKKKKKEKKGLKDKLTGDKKEEKYEDTSVPIERYEGVAAAPVHHSAEPVQPDEKKPGFLSKIKEKIPQKKTEEVHPPPPQAEYAEVPSPDSEGKEKKGLLEKIKEKLPGHHPKTQEEKDKESAAKY